MTKIKVLGVCADRPQSGKDTFAKLIKEINPGFERYAFADVLKSDLALLINLNFGWNIYELTPAQKEIVRPIMIAYGCARRAVNPLCWVEGVYNQIEINEEDVQFGNWIPTITDVRFENEWLFFQEKYGKDNCLLVEVHQSSAPPPPAEEIKNFPKLRAHVDYFIDWPDSEGDMDILRPYVRDFYIKYFA